jgi:hypothetical protein
MKTVGKNLPFTSWRSPKTFQIRSGAISKILLTSHNGLAFQYIPIPGYSQR